MKSRVHPKYKTKYHVRNWASYERALVHRGDVTVWLSPAAIAAWEPDAPSHLPPPAPPGRGLSDVAVPTDGPRPAVARSHDALPARAAPRRHTMPPTTGEAAASLHR